MESRTAPSERLFFPRGTTRRWFENLETVFNNREFFKADLRQIFSNQKGRERDEEQLRSRAQGPNESIMSFVEDILR